MTQVTHLTTPGSNFVNSSASFYGTNISGTISSDAISLSVAAGGGAAAISGSNGSFSFSTLTAGNLNGMSFYTSNGSLVGSYTVPSTAGLISAVNISAGTASNNMSAVTFSNSNGVSFGLNGSIVTASHNGLTTARASNDGVGLNTAQSNVTWTANSSGISLDARGYAGTATTFAGTNASASITLNSAGFNMALSAAAAGGGGGIALANSQTTYTSGTASLVAGGGAITVASNTGQRFDISVPAQSQISGTGGIQVSTNGSTISIGYGGSPSGMTYSRFDPNPELLEVPLAFANGSFHIQPMQAPNFQFDRAYHPILLSNSSNSTGTVTVSAILGIYTRNDSTLSLMHSSSSTIAITFSGTVNNSTNAGIRILPIGWTSTITQGDYWLGFGQRSTSGGTNATLTQLYISQLASNFSGEYGANSNASKQKRLGFGHYTATTSGIPTSIAFSQINGSGSLNMRPPVVRFISQTL